MQHSVRIYFLLDCLLWVLLARLSINCFSVSLIYISWYRATSRSSASVARRCAVRHLVSSCSRVWFGYYSRWHGRPSFWSCFPSHQYWRYMWWFGIVSSTITTLLIPDADLFVPTVLMSFTASTRTTDISPLDIMTVACAQKGRSKSANSRSDLLDSQILSVYYLPPYLLCRLKSDCVEHKYLEASYSAQNSSYAYNGFRLYLLAFVTVSYPLIVRNSVLFRLPNMYFFLGLGICLTRRLMMTSSQLLL